MRIGRFALSGLAGIAACAAVAAAAGAFVLAGGVDTGATRQHSRLVAGLLHSTMNASVRVRAKAVRAPDRFSENQLFAGARDYQAHCLACHGAPGIGRARWTSALVPTPPYLLDSSRRWSRAELYTIIHDGVRMTAMPAWGEVRRDSDIWNLVALLEAMPKMSPGRFGRLLGSTRAEASAVRASAGS